MSKKIGIILTIAGLVGTLIFGIQAVKDSETFSFLGIDIGISTADWTPVIISVVLLFLGVFLIGRK